MTTTPAPEREQLITRIVDHLTATPLPARPDFPTAPPYAAHSEHSTDGRCAICRASDMPSALRALVGAVLDALPDMNAPCPERDAGGAECVVRGPHTEHRPAWRAADLETHGEEVTDDARTD